LGIKEELCSIRTPEQDVYRHAEDVQFFQVGKACVVHDEPSKTSFTNCKEKSGKVVGNAGIIDTVSWMQQIPTEAQIGGCR
jgi:hypothetical protein